MESAAEGASIFVIQAKKNLVERPVYRAAPRLITLSKFFAGILRDEFGVPESRIRVVPGGFDPTPFSGRIQKDHAKGLLGLPPNRPLLVCVRRLAHRMGLENLIDAMAIVRKEFPDILLAIAGKGPISGELTKRIEERGLTENVRMMGFVPDEVLPALYSAAEFSVVPTVSLEGFGLIVAESLASGTPVIATRAGALPELLESFTPQLLATTPAPAHLAKVIDSALRGTIGLPHPDACRAHARQWAWDVVAPKILKVYSEVIESPNLRS
jgi:glycogen synthase